MFKKCGCVKRLPADRLRGNGSENHQPEFAQTVRHEQFPHLICRARKSRTFSEPLAPLLRVRLLQTVSHLDVDRHIRPLGVSRRQLHDKLPRASTISMTSACHALSHSAASKQSGEFINSANLYFLRLRVMINWLGSTSCHIFHYTIAYGRTHTSTTEHNKHRRMAQQAARTRLDHQSARDRNHRHHHRLNHRLLSWAHSDLWAIKHMFRTRQSTAHGTIKTSKSDKKRSRNLIHSFWRIIVIAYMAAMIANKLFLFDLSPLFASAGIIGVALGFGAQSLVKDFLSGVFIITENQYRVGDIVDIMGAAGTVERVGLVRRRFS